MNALPNLLDFTDTAQFKPLPLRPLLADNFAGGGGASTGIKIALGHLKEINPESHQKI